MKKVGKSIMTFFAALFSSGISTVLVIIFSRFLAYRKLKNKAAKKQCFILANGPSLNNDIVNINLQNRNNFDLFVVNEFCFSEKFEELQPEFYIIIDPAYWLKNQPAIESIIEKFYTTLNEKVSWQLQIFVPFSGYTSVEKKITNSNISLLPFNNTPVSGFNLYERFLYSYNLGVTQLQNVVVGAIYISILMKYKQVNLLGVDHDWHKKIHVDKHNYVVWQNKHFYDDGNSEAKYERIFNGDSYFDMQQIFKALSLTHQSYGKLASFAKHNEVNICNYTKESCIDAFERKL